MFIDTIGGLASSVGSSLLGGEGWLLTDTGELWALRFERPGYEPDKTLDNDGLPNSKSSSCGRLRDVDLARWLNAEEFLLEEEVKVCKNYVRLWRW